MKVFQNVLFYDSVTFKSATQVMSMFDTQESQHPEQLGGEVYDC